MVRGSLRSVCRITAVVSFLVIATGFSAAELQAQPVITTTSLPDGVQGVAYPSTTMTATGTVVTWSATGLPQGLSIGAVSGTITGTPNVTGPYPRTFNVSVTASGVGSDTEQFTIRIAAPLTIPPVTLPSGTLNTAYPSTTLTANGGIAPFTWTISQGSLPSGLQLSPSGVISGTPTNAGAFSFTVRVADSANPSRNATRQLSITVNIAPLSITTTSLPNGTRGTGYGQGLSATGGMAPITWTLATGSGPLPPGLVLSSAGVISGIPTAEGTFNFTVEARDSSTPTPLTATRGLSITINPPAPLNITTASLPAGTRGSGYAQSLAATGGVAPITWSLATGSAPLPPGLVISSAGVISGIPTAAGTFNFIVEARDSGTPVLTATRGLSITINAPPLSITTASLPAGTRGSGYAQSLAATGGVTPITWALATGSAPLPPGLVLSSAGVISGIPTATGTFNFTVEARDSSNPALTATKGLSITINPAPLSITTASLPSAIVGTAYSQSLAVTGGTEPYEWSVASGTLPPGLNLSATGAISGTPTATGNFDFTAAVNDNSVPELSTSKQFTISVTVATAPLSIASQPNLVGAAIGVPYSHTLVASGGTTPYTWTVTAGQVPPGLNLASNGTISGTPTSAGTFRFTARVNDAGTQNASREFTLIVQSTLTIITSSPLPPAEQGTNYSATLEASLPGLSSWTIISGSLPDGLSLSSGGRITGTPDENGTFGFTVRVSGGQPAQTATKAFELVVRPPPAPLAIATAAELPRGTPAGQYSVQLQATGGRPPYTWVIQSGDLPPGLSLSTSGLISGTPTGTGNFTVTIRVTDNSDAAQSATRTFSIVINPQQVLTITTGSLPNGIQNSAYSQQMSAVGGTAPYTWSVSSGTLPVGLTLTPAGTLEGTPLTQGSFSFTIRVTDAAAAVATQPLTMTVNSAFGLLSVSGLPASTPPAQQLPFTLTVSTAVNSTVTGELRLAFASNAVVPMDDPSVQFSSGGRTVSFTIPANSTTAIFPVQTLRLLTGSVSGTVQFSASIQNGPLNLPVGTITISPTAPVINNVVASRTASGLEIRITGYSPERRVSNAGFGFDVRGASGTQRVNLSRAVESEFASWYANPGSSPFGSGFMYIQSFNVQGDTSLIESVTITLTNGQGSTTSATVQIQ